MSLFGFIKKVAELPLNVAADVITAPKKFLDACDNLPVESSTLNKLGEIVEEMEE